MSAARLKLVTSDGVQLAADVHVPPSPVAATVIAHPHPLYGGDRHNNVVDALFQTLPTASIGVLRFDFRGAGQSDGVHDQGRGERLDVVAALDALLAVDGVAGLPVFLVGYSFGSMMVLGVVDARIAGWVAVAPPIGMGLDSAETLAVDPRPKLLLAPAHDQFTPPDQVRATTHHWINTTVEVVESADHFIAGQTAWVARRVVSYIEDHS